MYGYLFILGLPPCHTGKEESKEAYTGWRLAYESRGGGDSNLREVLANLILDEVFGKSGEEGSVDRIHGMTRIWNYATGLNENGVGSDIPDKGKAWIDKHLCPYYLWSSSSRKGSGKFCRYNCTVDSMEHIAIAAVDTYGFAEENEDWETIPTDPEFKGVWVGATIGNGSTYYMLMDRFFSALSVKMNYTGLTNTDSRSITSLADFPSYNYVLTKAPTDYVTIDYHDGENGPVTGSLKIVVLDEGVNVDNATSGIFPDNGGLSSGGLLLDVQGINREAYYTITQTNTCEYPVIWGCAL